MLRYFLRFILFVLVEFQPRPERERIISRRRAVPLLLICGRYPSAFK